MLSRRDFLGGATALAMTPLLERTLDHHERQTEPLLIRPAEPRRLFWMHRDLQQGHGFRIVTDALPFPRRLIEHSFVEETFGPGRFREQLGFDPEPSAENLCGMTFENYDDDDGGNPVVHCVSTRATSLLEAELLQRAASIEVRFKEMESPEVNWMDVLRNGDNLN